MGNKEKTGQRGSRELREYRSKKIVENAAEYNARRRAMVEHDNRLLLKLAQLTPELIGRCAGIGIPKWHRMLKDYEIDGESMFSRNIEARHVSARLAQKSRFYFAPLRKALEASSVIASSGQKADKREACLAHIKKLLETVPQMHRLSLREFHRKFAGKMIDGASLKSLGVSYKTMKAWVGESSDVYWPELRSVFVERGIIMQKELAGARQRQMLEFLKKLIEALPGCRTLSGWHKKARKVEVDGATLDSMDISYAWLKSKVGKGYGSSEEIRALFVANLIIKSEKSFEWEAKKEALRHEFLRTTLANSWNCKMDVEEWFNDVRKARTLGLSAKSIGLSLDDAKRLIADRGGKQELKKMFEKKSKMPPPTQFQLKHMRKDTTVLELKLSDCLKFAANSIVEWNGDERSVEALCFRAPALLSEIGLDEKLLRGLVFGERGREKSEIIASGLRSAGFDLSKEEGRMRLEKAVECALAGGRWKSAGTLLDFWRYNVVEFSRIMREMELDGREFSLFVEFALSCKKIRGMLEASGLVEPGSIQLRNNNQIARRHEQTFEKKSLARLRRAEPEPKHPSISLQPRGRER